MNRLRSFRSSLISPIFLAHFIRLRYHASPFTQQAVNSVTARIDAFANARGGPVAQGWATLKRAIGAWGGGKLVPQQPIPGRPNAAAGGAGAGAGARPNRQ